MAFSVAGWTAYGVSTANTELTVTKAAPTNQRHVILGFDVTVAAAAPTGDIVVQLKDGSTVIYQTVIGNAVARGSQIGGPFAVPLMCTSGNACSLVVAAGGASCVMYGNLWGDTV